MYNSSKWYLSIWFVVLMLIFFAPAGLILMFISPHFNRVVKIVVGVPYSLFLIFWFFIILLFIVIPDDIDTTPRETDSKVEVVDEDKNEEEINKKIVDKDGDDEEKLEEKGDKETLNKDKYLTQEDEEYLAKIYDYSMSISDNLTETGYLMQNFSYTDEWVLSMAVYIGTMRVQLNEVRQITPTDKFKDFHNVFIKSIDEYEKAYDKIPLGIDNLDEGLIIEAGEHLETGAEYTVDSTIILDDILDEYERE